MRKRPIADTAMLYFKSGNRRGYLQREAALALDLSTRTVRRMVKRGDLLTITVGRREYISPISIDDLLFEPSRLTQIVAEIDRIAEMMKDRHPGRRVARTMEEHNV